MPDQHLPEAFLTRPLAHRALHDAKAGRPENSGAAIRAAIAAGYGIEIDVQPSREGVPMVFHDDDLKRLTGSEGAIAQTPVSALTAMALKGSAEHIPTLDDILALVAGRVPLLIEIKDQDGALGPGIGPLEAHVAELVNAYEGPLALMSFNPHSVAALAEFAPRIPRGLTTCAFTGSGWGTVPATRRRDLLPIPDFDRVGACFISHDKADLSSPHVARIARRAPVLTWTVRSPAEERVARRVAVNITFESYPAPLDPGPETPEA